MEEIIRELLEKAKQNGSQATVILTEIQELLNGENPQIQDLLERAKQNGTQASVVLLEIEEILYGEEENLEVAKQNGSQSTTILVDLAENHPIGPTPIPVEGGIQIFADPECTQYATGVINEGGKIYVRINTSWGFGGNWNVGNSDEPGTCFSASAPDEENPNDPYLFTVWTGFPSDDYSQPFTAGQVVEINIPMEIDATNYQKVFTNPTIPVEGDIQIFADRACTQYATGSEKTVYARVNKSFGVPEYWQTSGPTDGDMLEIGSQIEGEPYIIMLWYDWVNKYDIYNPFTAGQVVECGNGNPEFTPLSNPTVIFSKPD